MTTDTKKPPLSATLSAWCMGGPVGLLMGLKLQEILYGPDHPLALDVSWWIVFAPFWAGIPPLLGWLVGEAIEKQRASNDEPC